MNYSLAFNHNFSFKEELSLGYHFIHVGEFNKVFDQYFYLISLIKSSTSKTARLHGFLIDIVFSISNLNIDYNTYEGEDDNSYRIEFLHYDQYFDTLLNKQKFPWVQKVGLGNIIQDILSFNKNLPKWNDKQFIKTYGLQSKINFGNFRGSTLQSLLESEPQEVIRLVNELYHFSLSYSILLSPHLIAHVRAQAKVLLYWKIAARCVIKELVRYELEEITSVIDDRRGDIREERRQSLRDSQDWLETAYEGDASNLWNTD